MPEDEGSAVTIEGLLSGGGYEVVGAPSKGVEELPDDEPGISLDDGA